jgi:hypothetical protein
MYVRTKPTMTNETMSRPLAEIPPIQHTQGELITSMNDIERFVESPAVPACQDLFNKNIRTVSASANAKDVNACAYIDVDASSLSEENRAIAARIGRAISYRGNRDQDASLPVDAYKLSAEVTSNDTEESIAAKLFGLAAEFQQQPLTWLQTFTMEQMKKVYGYKPHESPAPQLFTDFYYDAVSGTFFPSEELFRKSQQN